MNHIFKFISKVRQAQKDNKIYRIDMLNEFDDTVTFEVAEAMFGYEFYIKSAN